MVPKLLFVVFFGVFAYADKQPYKRTSRILNGSHTNSTYGHRISSKNTTLQGHAEIRTGERIQGNFVVRRPEGQSVSDVHYTADAREFHPIVRLPTQRNRSQVTSHFALGQSAVEKLNEQKEKSFEIPLETKDSKKDGLDEPKDTISQVLESLFPDGIPSKYSILVNSTEGLNFKDSTEKALTTHSTTETSRKVVRDGQDFGASDHKKVVYKDNSDIETAQNYFDSQRFSHDSSRKLKSLVSDEEVLRINDAAENYTEGVTRVSRTHPTLNSYPPVIELRPIDKSNSNIVYPFESPIVVEEIPNDNSVSSSPENSHPFVEPPNEVSIRPFREEFLNTENIEPERLINVKIFQPNLNEIALFKTGLLRATTASDLDAFQQIVEDSFSNSQNFNTEAPSRIFLRDFNQNSPKSTNIEVKNSNDHFVESEIDRSGSTTEEGDEEQEEDVTQPPASSNENFIEDSVSTTTPHTRSRGKTFVEIQKALNIQNLLIKEDADTIERHEEFLQPLAVGRRLTHRIQSKFMKEKPWQNSKKQPIEISRHVDPVTIESSISYPIEHTDQHLLDHQHQSDTGNKYESISLEQHQSSQHYSEDPEEKDVEESIQIGQLHTKVDYSSTKEEFRNNGYSSKIKNSESGPVVTKLFPFPEEKIVEKKVRVPFAVKEYIEKIVEKPVPVEKIVHRPVPVPYLVPVDRIVETPIHIPYPVEQIVEVEKLIETEVPIAVEKYIDRPVPVPVEKIVNRPYPVEKIVEKVVNRPVPVHIPVKIPIRVPVPIHVPVQIAVPNGYFTSTHQPSSPSHSSHNQNNQNNFFNLEYNQTPQESVYLAAYSPQQNFPEDINHLIKQKQLCKNKQQHQNRYAKKIEASESQNFNQLRDEYFGPVPLQNEYSHWGGQHFKRSSEFGRNLRMEYGFKPPLIPSIEIDDQGLPINRNKDS